MIIFILYKNVVRLENCVEVCYFFFCLVLLNVRSETYRENTNTLYTKIKEVKYKEV